MSITVAEEGNRRTGGMTGAEVEQCAFDIKSWFLRTAGESIRSIGGASTVDIQRLEKSIDTRIPNEIKTLLTEINGGIYFFDKKLMSTEEVREVYTTVDGSKKWSNSLFPICGDESSMLVIHIGENNAVYEWDSDDGLGDKISPSFSAYIENYRNMLLGGHCEYIKDVGVLEKMTARKK